MSDEYPPELYEKTKARFLERAAKMRRERRLNCCIVLVFAMLILVPLLIQLLKDFVLP